MALMPRRVKHRKSQRRRIKGNATRGNTVAFGDWGLQSLEPGHVRATTIEACRIAVTQYIRGEGKLYIRVFPDKPVTARPLETRMGKGKGEPDHWVAVVKPGTVRGFGDFARSRPRVFCSGGLQTPCPRPIARATPLGLARTLFSNTKTDQQPTPRQQQAATRR